MLFYVAIATRFLRFSPDIEFAVAVTWLKMHKKMQLMHKGKKQWSTHATRECTHTYKGGGWGEFPMNQNEPRKS